MMDINKTPNSEPNTVPSPPFRLHPPITQAENNTQVRPFPAKGKADPRRDVAIMPANPSRRMRRKHKPECEYGLREYLIASLLVRFRQYNKVSVATGRDVTKHLQ